MRRHAKAILAGSALLLLTLAVGTNLATAVAPVVTIDPAPTASYATAQVTGTVNPEDQETYFYVQYAIDPDTEGWSSSETQGPLAPGSGLANVSANLTGLKPGTTYEVRLVAENFSEPAQAISAEPNPTFATKAVGPPTVTLDPVTTFTGTTAHLSGSIDPEAPVGNPAAFDVSWRFECTPECPGLSGATIPADSDSHVVEADTSGLQPNTSYEVTLVAENAAGSVSDGPEAFKTPQVAPEVQTLYAGSVDTDSAVLAANVNPKNAATTYQFEWGTDESYGNLAPATAQALGAEDNAFHLVTAPVSGLAPGTTYHFRVVATNTDTSASSAGVDHTFTSDEPAGPPAPCANAQLRTGPSAALPDCRAYEMVSPLDKNGGDIDRNVQTSFATSAAAPSGDGVAYTSGAQFAGIPSGTPYGQYVSRRLATGWLTRGVAPPMELDPNQNGPLGPFVVAFSRDLSGALVRTNSELTPGANSLLNGSWGLYRQDNFAPSWGYQLLSAPEAPLPSDTEVSFNFARFDFVAATPDLSHVVFNSARQLTSDAGPSSPSTPTQVYEWDEGQVRYVSVLPGPDALPATEAVGGQLDPANNGNTYPGDHVISEDGSRIYFTVRSGAQGLYVRENGSETKTVSASEISGEVGEIKGGATFQGARADDGAVAFFSAGPLTDDSPPVDPQKPNKGTSLYRWDATEPLGSRLTDLTAAEPSGEPRFLGIAGLNDAATAMYFVARGDLAPGAVAGPPNLYRWAAGEGITHVATLVEGDGSVWERTRLSTGPTSYRAARVSEDGARLLFTSHAQLTSYPTGGFEQVYLYDALKEDLICVSCSSLLPGSTAPAELFPLKDPVTLPKASYELPRNLSADGQRVFFETAQPLLSADHNDQADLYLWDDGALSLISTGQGRGPSRFISAGANGEDVFFTTRERLVATDTDNQVDLYDARLNGGFPAPSRPSDCGGDSCQTPGPMPAPLGSPGSVKFSGAGNRHRARCPKGKVRRGKHCVKKGKKRANQNRRAGR